MCSISSSICIETASDIASCFASCDVSCALTASAWTLRIRSTQTSGDTSSSSTRSYLLTTASFCVDSGLGYKPSIDEQLWATRPCIANVRHFSTDVGVEDLHDDGRHIAVRNPGLFHTPQMAANRSAPPTMIGKTASMAPEKVLSRCSTTLSQAIGSDE